MASFLLTFFSVFTVACAAAVVLNKNAVNGAMCLLLCLVGVAGLFVRLDAFLLAYLLLLVYAGAVVTLFLFIIMLLDIQGQPAGPRPRGRAAAGAVVAAVLAAGLASLLAKGRLAAPSAAAVPALGASLKLYAYRLFTVYLLPVEVVGFLLLVAMLGAVALSKEAGDAPADSRRPTTGRP